MGAFIWSQAWGHLVTSLVMLIPGRIVTQILRRQSFLLKEMRWRKPPVAMTESQRACAPTLIRIIVPAWLSNTQFPLIVPGSGLFMLAIASALFLSTVYSSLICC